MFDQPKSRTLDASNRRSHKRNKMPDWLKAALGDDVINPHQMDDEEEEGEFRRRLVGHFILYCIYFCLVYRE